MLNKITRRRFVSSLSVLAAMPLLSPRAVRAATGKTVSVDRYNNKDWIAAFKQAFAEGDTVVARVDANRRAAEDNVRRIWAVNGGDAQ